MGNKQEKDAQSYPKPVRSQLRIEHHGPLVTDDISKVTNQQSENFRRHKEFVSNSKSPNDNSLTSTSESLPAIFKEKSRSEQKSSQSNQNHHEKHSKTTTATTTNGIQKSRSSSHIPSSSKIVTVEDIINNQRKNRDGKSSATAMNHPPSPTLSTKKGAHRKKQIPNDLKLILIHPNEIKILEQVGRGNFGTVYHGLHKGTRDIALKCLHSNGENVYRGSIDDIDPSIYDLLHEANIMSKLRHPNLTRIIGITFFGDEQRLSLITDFMKNGSLLHYLRNHREIFLKSDHRLITKKLNHFARQIFEAMSYLEDREIIHRDLAARNCLIGDEDILKVGDFGLTTLTECGLYKGTYRTVCAPRWTAPEAIFSSKYTSRSDAWSFGITLWELYSLGERPFGSLSNNRVTEILKNPSGHLSQHLPKPRPFASEETYTHIILRCLTHNLTMRPRFKDLRERLFTIFQE